MTQTLCSIYDKSTSNALFAGVEHYFYTTSPITMSGNNVISTNNKTHQQSFTAEDGTAEPDKYINSYNRKKAMTQYTGFNYNVLTVNILLKYDERNITTRNISGVNVLMLTLPKLMHFIRTPKTYYLKDDVLIKLLVNNTYSYYKDYGFPVVIESWSLNPTEEKDVVITLNLREDYDSFIGS